jgi:hypothetical protein
MGIFRTSPPGAFVKGFSWKKATMALRSTVRNFSFTGRCFNVFGVPSTHEHLSRLWEPPAAHDDVAGSPGIWAT